MAIRYQTIFSIEGRHLSPLTFKWVHLSVFITFSCLNFLLHFGEDLCLFFIRTCDQKIPAHKFWFQVAWNIEKEVTKMGVSIWLLKEDFWENFY